MAEPSPPQSAALIFINWNSGELLVRAVESMIGLDHRGQRFRIVVVDNGSTDDALTSIPCALEPLIAQHPDLFLGLELLPLGENTGFAHAVNTGLRHAAEPFALVLNTDIRFVNAAPRLLTDALAADPDAVLACPRLLREDGSEQPAAVPLPSLVSELTNRSLWQRRLVRRLRRDAPSPVPSVVGPCMAVCRDRLPADGLLDERFFFFFEETDWCKRLGDTGLRVLWVPAAEVIHLQGASANRRPVRARIQFYESRYRYFRKHVGGAATAVLAAGLVLRLLVNCLGSVLLILLTGGRSRHRDKLAVYAAIVRWHLLGCPRGHGFEPADRPLP